MNDLSRLCDFSNLYHAHLAARRGKRNRAAVIRFELDLAANICRLSDAIRSGAFLPLTYHHFRVFEPKQRDIHALQYADRVVLRCLSDEILAPVIEPRLIYDNAACRSGKGVHFSLDRLSMHLREHYRRHGTEGYIVTCDIESYFASIDHTVLIDKLVRLPFDRDMRDLLCGIVGSFGALEGRGLPLGNHTSQWFALLYLDAMDRMIKERLRVRGYVRYMDDFVLLLPNKQRALECLKRTEELLVGQLHLQLNAKTTMEPLRCGVRYLGWHVQLASSGGVRRTLLPSAKKRFVRAMKLMAHALEEGIVSPESAMRRLSSHAAHLSHGQTHRLAKRWMPGCRAWQRQRLG
jgi:hypothetical protein